MKCYWFPVKRTADNFNSVVIFSFVVIRGAGLGWRLFFFGEQQNTASHASNGNSQRVAIAKD